MLNKREKLTGTSASEDRCDVRVWSGACEHTDSATGREEYLCPLCETVADLNHEIRHEIFPHVSGDYANLA